MSEQNQSPVAKPQYFAVEKATLQEVLQYFLQTNAGVNLYQKLANSMLVVEAPAQADSDPKTDGAQS